MRHGFRHALGLAMGASLVAGMLATPVAAAPSVIHVGDGTGGGVCADPEFTTIQSAVDAAGQGAEIVVCPGVYRELVLVRTNGLTIRAIRPWVATLMPPLLVTSSGRQPDRPDTSRLYGHSWGMAAVAPANSASLVGILGANSVTLQWMDLVAPTGGACASMATMVLVADGSRRAHIASNRIRPTGPDTMGRCGYWDAVEVYAGASAQVDHNLLIDFMHSGVVVTGADSKAMVAGNSIRFEHATAGPGMGGSGVYIGFLASGSVKRNVVRSLRSASNILPGETVPGTPMLNVGIFIADQAHDVLVRHNVVTHAEYGIVVYAGSGRTTVHGNTVRDSKQNGMDVNEVTGTLVEENVVVGSTLDGLAVVGAAVDNVLRDNDLRGNDEHDCRDDSTGGTGTGITDNEWTANRGDDANVAGICRPGVVIPSR